MQLPTYDFPQAEWRLIISEPASGLWNMAVDEALLETMDHPDSKPVFRLYAWNPPCLSLGYAQPLADARLDTISENGWEIVRRATGGRAILHTDELTYAVITPKDEPRMAGGVLPSYKRISTALFHALSALNLPVEIAEKNIPQKKTIDPVCFDVPSTYEITLQGKKIVGSAQARKASGILQHGSFPLTGDLTRIADALTYEDETARQKAKKIILQKATTAELDGKVINRKAAEDALISSFSKVLNINFISSSLSAEEEKLVSKHVERKSELD